jgi:hypothetical protein
MAIYHFSAKVISRSTGRSSVAAAAYRAGELLVNERTGQVCDFTRKRGVIHAEVVLPGGGTMDRSTLWNAVEKKHTRGDATTAREFEIALPAELTHEQRLSLMQSYTRELADTYKVGIDFAIHAPDDGGLNWHAHVLMTACYVDESGAMGKKAVELDPIHCQRAKIANAVEIQRARWQDVCNAALDAAGHDARIDHRTLEAQGVTDRVATTHLGPSVSQMDRDGRDSEVLARIQNQVAELTAKLMADVAIERAAREAALEIPRIEDELAQLYEILKKEELDEHRSRPDEPGLSEPADSERGHHGSDAAGAADPSRDRKRTAERFRADFGVEFDGRAVERPGAFRRLADALAKPGIAALGVLREVRTLNSLFAVRSGRVDGESRQRAVELLQGDAPGQLPVGGPGGLRRPGDGQDDVRQVTEQDRAIERMVNKNAAMLERMRATLAQLEAQETAEKTAAEIRRSQEEREAVLRQAEAERQQLEAEQRAAAEKAGWDVVKGRSPTTLLAVRGLSEEQLEHMAKLLDERHAELRRRTDPGLDRMIEAERRYGDLRTRYNVLDKDIKALTRQRDAMGAWNVLGRRRLANEIQEKQELSKRILQDGRKLAPETKPTPALQKGLDALNKINGAREKVTTVRTERTQARQAELAAREQARQRERELQRQAERRLQQEHHRDEATDQANVERAIERERERPKAP